MNSFSRHAATYDDYAFVQRDIAVRLLDEFDYPAAENILEIGCGTGNYTALLRTRFLKARITALDISGPMLNIAVKKNIEGIAFLKADAATFTTAERFDLITSNACLQWIDGLEAALMRYKEMLMPGGVMTFSTFGPQTYHELAHAVCLAGVGGNIAAQDFLPQEELTCILKKVFNSFEVKQFFIKEDFNDLNSFLRSVKYSGTYGPGLNGKAGLTRGQLKRLESAYRERFNKITATYEVFLCLVKS